MYRIFYHRDVHELPLIVTTNYTVDELADRLGEASISRLLGLCAWHETTTPDFRVSTAE